MKRLLLFTFLSILMCVDINADGSAAAQINLQKKKVKDGHFDQPIPDVEPEVYYDNDAHELTIVGTGFASYYDVEIMSVTTSTVYISTRVDGSYDTIDVSSLPDDNYKIVISTLYHNIYEGYFTNY